MDDFDLLDRWRDGDRSAGNQLFQRHFESVNRFFENKLGQDVDDLVQTTFLQLTRDADKFRKQASFRTYLFAIARNQLYRYLRKHIGKKDVDFSYKSLADMNTSPPSRLVNDERKLFLLDALRTLPLEQQLLIELYYWEDVSVEALAQVFEIAAPTVRTRLFRARAALRDKMAKLSEKSRAAGEDGDSDSLDAWAHGLRATWVGP
ncbi:RNA polymerase sigma-70 factor [Plesiocystis pacifica SIR-1]|uniref:RNA polymerase sigma-70 factor n=1 Tax=Plesiocystis pacifica SIR-1 TaxID=391625 RepID=A6G3R4_9BACT|nr:sigma-70 family RNA polymerase sigma factor [Plesiocystis pacifica]EDM79451.1 RNA polymerase sigma-70 factor [Plesiocystis pacifica SIR-1]